MNWNKEIYQKLKRRRIIGKKNPISKFDRFKVYSLEFKKIK